MVRSTYGSPDSETDSDYLYLFFKCLIDIVTVAIPLPLSWKFIMSLYWIFPQEKPLQPVDKANMKREERESLAASHGSIALMILSTSSTTNGSIPPLGAFTVSSRLY